MKQIYLHFLIFMLIHSLIIALRDLAQVIEKITPTELERNLLIDISEEDNGYDEILHMLL